MVQCPIQKASGKGAEKLKPMKTCFFCNNIILTPDVTIDNIEACVPCGRYFNKVKIRLMQQMIDDQSEVATVCDCIEFPFI
jgi:hypothetical protein